MTWRDDFEAMKASTTACCDTDCTLLGCTYCDAVNLQKVMRFAEMLAEEYRLSVHQNACMKHYFSESAIDTWVGESLEKFWRQAKCETKGSR